MCEVPIVSQSSHSILSSAGSQRGGLPFMVLIERRAATLRQRLLTSLLMVVIVLTVLLGLSPAQAQTARSKVALDLQLVIASPITPKLNWAKDVNGMRMVKVLVVSNSTDPDLVALRADVLAKSGLTPVWRGLRRLTVAVENRLKPNRPKRSFPATRADEMLFLQGAEAYKHLLAFYPDAAKEALLTSGFKAKRGDSQTTAYLDAALARAQDADTATKWCYADLVTYLPEDILYKVDIASMAVSLECRSPFLDHRVVEFAYSLPGRYKLSAGGRHKHILKEAFKDWLPAGFMDRPKQGFSAPLARWLREDFGPLLRERLLDQQTLAPWFDQAQVTRYVEEHLSGRGSHSQRLWPLLVLAIWIKRFGVDVTAP